MNNTQELFNLTPLDGRYAGKIKELSVYFSEAALQRYRIIIEIEWLIHLCNTVKLDKTRELSKDEIAILQNLYLNFDEKSATTIKDIEKITNHDVKAVEYFIKQNLNKTSVSDMLEFVHFGCTSEDINNLCHAMMLRDAIDEVIAPSILTILTNLKSYAVEYKDISMLARTHGQSASPTTIGKEFLVFASRIDRQLSVLLNHEYLGKFNGAVGNYNAHLSAYPNQDWLQISNDFIVNLGLTPNMITTQIENHDYISEIFDTIKRINNIVLDLDRDLWSYISSGYFKQKLKKGEVGSSTMPHKVNPIDFENSEGNLGMANAVLNHMSQKLQISRLQRDLTDSTVLRNMGVGLGYSILAYSSTLKGLGKLELNADRISIELNNHWEVLAEPIQTVMRKHGIEKPYEKLKELSRGKEINKETLSKFIDTLKLPESEKTALKKLTPENYIGLASKLVSDLLKI